MDITGELQEAEIIRVCEICGTEFHPKSNRQKYCGEGCIREAKTRTMRKLRKQYGVHNKKKWLGTGSLGGGPYTDFKEEMKAIQKEKVRCGLL